MIRSIDLVSFAWDGECFSDPYWKRVECEMLEQFIGLSPSEGAAARGVAKERAVDQGGSVLIEGQWYSLPDGTAVQVRGPGAGIWHLVAADGTPAYVVFGSVERGFQIRRLLYRASVADDCGTEGHLKPVFQAVVCDLTLEDLRLVTDA